MSTFMEIIRKNVEKENFLVSKDWETWDGTQEQAFQIIDKQAERWKKSKFKGIPPRFQHLYPNL